MKKFVATMVAVLMCAGSAVAGTLGGAAKKGHTISAEINFNKKIIKIKDPAKAVAVGLSAKERIGFNSKFLRWDFAPANRFGFFLKLGFLEGDVYTTGNASYFKNKLAFGLGMKGEWLATKSGLKLGSAVSFVTGSPEIKTSTTKSEIDYSALDLTLLYFSKLISAKKTEIYGGIKFNSVDADVKVSGMGAAVDGTYKAEGDNDLGLFLGANKSLNDNWSVGGELRLMDEFGWNITNSIHF